MRLIVLLIATMLVGACRDTTVVYPPTGPTSPTNPTPLPNPPGPNPPITITYIEFRVTGTPKSALVRWSNGRDGLTQVVTTLPFVNNVVVTNDQFMFLSLEATPTDYYDTARYPFLAIQIFVNGNLFREASSTDVEMETLSVSGTWRR